MEERRIYKFGQFRLDATVKVLSKDGEPVHAPRKAVETLLALVENPGQVLSKDELMAKLWPDRIVNEANLAQNIAVVRRFMKVEPGAPGYIETFPGSGYRILGPVTSCEEAVSRPARDVQVTAPQAAEQNGSLGSVPGRRWSRLWVAAGAAVVLIMATGWLMSRRAGRLDVTRRSPVTRLEGKEYQPAISPDGKSVAFAWKRDEAGKGAIWVQRAESQPPQRISPDDGASYESPAWSPDGQELAYLRLRQDEGSILISPAAGGTVRTVVKVFPSRYDLPQHHLDWSPDGQFLAVDDAEPGHQALGIFLVRVDTGEKKRLTQPDDLAIGDLAPRFSPDGRIVSFVRALHRARQELFWVAVSGGTAQELTNEGRQISGQDWTREGLLVYGSNRSGEFRLWKMRAGGGKPQDTGIYGDFPIQLSVARRAPALVYSVLQHNLNIWRLDLKGAGSGRWSRLIASSAQDASPQYSPQGDRICFRSDRSGEEQMWVSDSDGGRAVQVTQGALRPSVGRWSPDGRTVIFNNTTTADLYAVRLGAGGEWSVQALGVQGVHPVFSADGQWIYAGTMTSMVKIRAEGGAATEIAPMMGISLGASRDDRYVYFVREPAGTALWRVDVASGATEKVLDGLVPYCSSCWALSPSGIYFLGGGKGSGGRQALYFHELASGKETAVVDYPEALSPIGSGPFSLSPDGRYLLCVRVEPSNSDVFRVEPFR